MLENMYIILTELKKDRENGGFSLKQLKTQQDFGMVSSKMHIPCEHGGRWKVVSKINQRLKT